MDKKMFFHRFLPEDLVLLTAKWRILGKKKYVTVLNSVKL